jgi:hypothetical protein
MLEGGAGVVIGSRSLESSVVQARHSAVREWGAAVFRWTVQRVVDSVDDTQCGYKFFDGALARRIFPQVACGGFAFDVEVLARAQRAGHRIIETPVNWIDVPGSSFSPVRDGVRSFIDVAGIDRRLRREERRLRRQARRVGHSAVQPVAVARVADGRADRGGDEAEPGRPERDPVPAFGSGEGA